MNKKKSREAWENKCLTGELTHEGRKARCTRGT